MEMQDQLPLYIGVFIVIVHHGIHIGNTRDSQKMMHALTGHDAQDKTSVHAHTMQRNIQS